MNRIRREGEKRERRETMQEIACWIFSGDAGILQLYMARKENTVSGSFTTLLVITSCKSI